MSASVRLAQADGQGRVVHTMLHLHLQAAPGLYNDILPTIKKLGIVVMSCTCDDMCCES